MDVIKPILLTIPSELDSTNSPRFPNQSDFTRRTFTFAKWPKGSAVRVVDLVNSGFMYMGVEDRVQCFYCGGILNNWKHGDEVDEEHFGFFPHCEFIRNKLGRDPIDNSSAAERTNGPPSESQWKLNNRVIAHNVQYSQAPTSITNRSQVLAPGSGVAQQEQVRHHDVASRDIRARLCTESSLRLLQMGYKESLLAQVIGERLALTGDDFRSFTEYFTTVQRAADILGGGHLDVLDEFYRKSLTVVHKPAVPKATTSSAPQSRESVPSPSSSHSSNSGDSFTRKKECSVCMDKEADTVFVPCRHMCVCNACSMLIEQCPICRRQIQNKIKVYA